MKKTFHEQLAEAANSLGFNTKSPEKKRAKKRIKVGARRPAGSEASADQQLRAHTDDEQATISSAEFCPDVMRCIDSLAADRKRLRISYVQEFCCLADLAIKFPSHCKTWRFKRSLCSAAARASLSIDLAPALLDEGEASAFERTFAQIRDWIPKEDLKKARRELVHDCCDSLCSLANQKLRPFRDLAEKLKDVYIKCCFDPPILDKQDLELAIDWCNGSVPKVPDKEILANDFGDNWKLGRSLSARLAEKIAAEFYLLHGFQVEDVSIQQITARNSANWQNHDLNVSGRPVDVKNSRRSQHSVDNYTEHCVATFKVDRDNKDVAICGVFSPYLPASRLLNSSKISNLNPIIILGETTRTDQHALKEEFEEDGLLEIDIRRIDGGVKSFIPPWMFDYPDWAYAERDAVLEQLRQVGVPHTTICKTAKYNPIPASISAGIELREIWDEDSLSPWEWHFVSTLTRQTRNLGLSRPVLFLTILKHFLNMAATSPRTKEYRPNEYRRFIFQDDILEVPLGVYDPLKTIDSLICCLDKLWSADRELIMTYKMFKLQNLNILLGKAAANDHWKTLIAYCGGRDPSNNAACGKNPLVLGESRHCPICGKLICPDCDFCSKDCVRQ